MGGKREGGGVGERGGGREGMGGRESELGKIRTSHFQLLHVFL